MKKRKYPIGGEVSSQGKRSFSRGGESLLSTMTRQGNLDMAAPRKKSGDCGCKKMNMGGTTPSANTYSGEY